MAWTTRVALQCTLQRQPWSAHCTLYSLRCNDGDDRAANSVFACHILNLRCKVGAGDDFTPCPATGGCRCSRTSGVALMRVVDGVGGVCRTCCWSLGGSRSVADTQFSCSTRASRHASLPLAVGAGQPGRGDVVPDVFAARGRDPKVSAVRPCCTLGIHAAPTLCAWCGDFSWHSLFVFLRCCPLRSSLFLSLVGLRPHRARIPGRRSRGSLGCGRSVPTEPSNFS